jgi:symplekin
MLQYVDEPSTKKQKTGLNRLAASHNDKDSWVTIVTRLATRVPAGLESATGMVKAEGTVSDMPLTDKIREALYLYVLEDFRHRIEVAVAWLCEEWYNDRVQEKCGLAFVPHYQRNVLKVLDGMMPYLDAKDKVLTRFLSEIPEVTMEMLQRVKSLCRDPSMVNLAITSLLYLVMMKMPAREIALNAVQDIWQDCKHPYPLPYSSISC